MKSRAEFFLLSVSAFALGGAAMQEMPPVPDDMLGGTSQLQPGEVRVDQVGYATPYEGAAPPRISAYAAHSELSAGSFADVTALDSGKTILVAITDQAALPAGTIVTLSPAAASQLGLDLSRPAPVRVRAITPTAQDEAALVSGGAAPSRLDAPEALLKGLRAQLATPTAPVASATPAASAPTPPPTPTRKPVTVPKPAPTATLAAATRKGKFLVQVGSFSNAANAKSLANRLGGFTDGSGGLTRVRMGPFATRAEADAARAKAATAGYRDATVVRVN